MSRIALGLSLAAAALAVGVSRAEPDFTNQGPAPLPLTQPEIGGRLRVFAGAGDWKLQNPLVTAVIRKRDGWLTEFWRNTLVLPTSDQLDTLTEVDGIWQVMPVVRIGDKNYPVEATRVAALPHGLEVEGSVTLGNFTFKAVTTHSLHPIEPRIRMKTTFSVVGGVASGPLSLGDEIKWGNVMPYVDAVPKPRLSYKGRVEWVGRRGAGGDLMLRPIEPNFAMLDYRASKRGFQGPMTAIYKKGIRAGESVSFTRDLVFEKIPVPDPTPPSSVGWLSVRVRDEAGRLMPAKIRLDLEGRKDPIFPDDGGLYGSDRFMWTGNGDITRELPTGRYQMLVTGGIERDAFKETIDIKQGETTKIVAHLPRAVATPGWIGADLHLHQAPSVDADISLPARITAIAAEGVEFAVATDHYVTTDLAPTVKWMQEKGALMAKLQTMAGQEVSTTGNRFGHFNVFPLKKEPIVAHDTTAKKLFASIRQVAPQSILQVNHPRWGAPLGYFTYFRVHDKTGEAKFPGYEPNFDALEVYNGDDAYDFKLIRDVLTDWMHVLGRGYRYTATGSSDSHNLAFLDPGLPRTMIKHGAGNDDATDVDAPASSVIAALKAGRAIVTSGPIIEATIEGKGPGETLKSPGKKPKLRIVVKAAPWIDVRALEVLEGPHTRRLAYVGIPRSKNVVRLDTSIDLKLPEKTFVVVIVQGERGLPNASREGTIPFAFTNPIWIEP
jgi:hypothetical protein